MQTRAIKRNDSNLWLWSIVNSSNFCEVNSQNFKVLRENAICENTGMSENALIPSPRMPSGRAFGRTYMVFSSLLIGIRKLKSASLQGLVVEWTSVSVQAHIHI
ncbi:hypothetical protein MLD38_009870 [Melastoma candidum]|uniref:Uncharacterized protein n=1 Tax=Melastoma candidum TaxID=119954 RepID=A0ACB9RYK3_9MYRT|nr:hypothetical protein MLD38_009870 [Melastoma candidum]